MKKIFFFLVHILPISVLYGQETDSLYYYLNEVTVVKPKTIKEVVPVQELRGEELQKLNAHSVADALRYFSGVQLKDYGGVGGLKTINVRSMGGEHVGVFYDGIEISNPQNGVVDLGRFSLENMEAVSLYNGQKSNVLQAAKDFASAASLYMKTRVPRFSGTQKSNFRVGFKTGAFDLVNPSIAWEQKINKHISSALNIEYLKSSGKYKYSYKQVNNLDDRKGYDTTAVRQNGDIEIFRIEQSLHGHLSDGEWNTKAYLYASDRGYPGAVIREAATILQHQDRQKDFNFFMQGSIKKQLTEKHTTQLLAKYANDYIHYKSDTLAVKYDNTYRLQDFYISSANMYSILPFWSMNLAVDYQYNTMNANISDFMHPKRHHIFAAAATSLYWKGIKLQGNILYTHIHEETTEYIRTTNELGQIISVHQQSKKANQNKFTPSVVASWQPFRDEQFFVRAFYKNIFRMPTFSEMYIVYSGGIPSNLKPETSKQYDLGVVYTKKLSSRWEIELQADAYYNEIKNKLMAIGGGANFRWTIMNKGLVKIKGTDISLSSNYAINNDLSVSAKLNYTYQDAKDYTPMKVESDSIYYKGQIPYIPWNSGSAILGASYKDWDFNYSFVYTGKRYNNSANLAEYIVKPWYTHDLSLSKEFRSKQYIWRATMEINNILNQSYEIISRYPMPGTNFKFIIRLTI